MKVVIGAGLSGLSAAYHLKGACLVLEKEKEVGGLCRSVNTNGYVFDYAPHILFTKNDYVKNLLEDLLKNNLIKQIRKSYIYLDDTFVEYPFEVNLNALSREKIEDCINGLLKRDENEPQNFEEWIYTTYGDGIARHYMIPYNRKVWKYDLDKINTDWILGRVPSPSVQEIRRGARQKTSKNYGPNVEFYYPRRGGIGAFANSLASSIDKISLNSKVVKINPLDKKLKITYVKEGEKKEILTDHAISSVPLPDLVEMIEDAPREVRRAAGSLVYNSLVCVSVGVKRPGITDKHWVYFPEEKFVFNRVSFPMNFSELTTPVGRSSILVEVTHREDHADVEYIKEKVYEGLIKTDIIKDRDIIEVYDVSHFKYAYVIYDLNHRNNVGIIHAYLKSNNIIPIGRFGEWEYFNMDKAVLSGRRAAVQFNEDIP